MLYKWRRKLKTWNFDRQISGIFDTPPLRVVDADWTIASMIMIRDVPMYILGIKAFYQYLGAGRIIGIVARQMPQSLRDMLRRHIDGIELLTLEDIDTGTCQRGGTWERLVFLLDRSRDRYMIQMDSDVLAVGPDLHELTRCIHDNVAFTIANYDQLAGMRSAAQRAQAEGNDRYVGIAVEQRFDRYPGCDDLRYVRGSSGLAGFARGGFSRARLEAFHGIMQELLPERWQEWGTEQCASNFAVANSPGSVVLPFPAYASFGPGVQRELCKCIHFIGAYRFQDNYFADRAREVIARLATPRQSAA